jgi:enamine deaminase RidA (YjgF/YER057c/UK114 family)
LTTPYDRLKALGLSLPTPAVPVANYVPFVLANGFLYLSGQGPRRPDGTMATGKVGSEVGLEQAYLDAQLTGLNLLAVAHMALGDLARVRRVVKVLGMVNADPDFGDHPKVINGCSDLFVNVLGDAGKHARSAVGMGSLPGRISVEIEAILQVDG